MKRWLKRVALGVLLSLLLTTFGITWDWYATRRAGQKKLDAIVAKLDAEDPGWRLHDLNDARNAKLPPDEKNGAVVVRRAVALIPKEFDDWSANAGMKFVTEERNRLPDSEALAEVERILPACRSAHDLLRSVPTVLPGGNRVTVAEPNPLNTPVDDANRMRRATYLIGTYQKVAVSKNDPARACEDCRLVLAVARCVGDEPTQISQLVRLAMTAVAVNDCEFLLGCTEPTTGLPELQAELAAEVAVPRFVYGLRGDRAVFFRLLENLDSGSLSLETLGNEKTRSSSVGFWFAHYRKNLPDDQALALELFNDHLAACGRGGPARLVAGKALDARIRSLSVKDQVLVLKLFPATDRVDRADLRINGILGCAVAGIACERHRQKTGAWPKALTDVPKEILPEIPIDPFTGNPVQFKQTATGAVVYSTGEDGADDGGETLDPKMLPGTDVGFRLYDPAHRRLAAKPRPPADGEEPK